MRSVLHVLPHPGGGGETYVDALSGMEGYEFERLYLAPSSRPSDVFRSLARTAIRVQAVAHKHELVHVQGEVAAAICLPALALRPSIVTLNGLHLLRRLNGLARLAAQANLRLVLKAVSRLICVAEAERADLIVAVGAAAARDKVVVIHNAVRPLAPATRAERDAARTALGLDEAVVAGAWVAGLHAHKDPLTAVEATLGVERGGAPLALLVAGEGPLRGELDRASAGSQAVRLLGFRKDVRPVLAAADFFVLSSQREGLSFALLEAMSMGLPPVVSDGPGNPEAVGDAGIIVPFGDVAGFADAFRRLLGDERARRELGERARSRVVAHFGVDEMVRRTREVYEAALA